MVSGMMLMMLPMIGAAVLGLVLSVHAIWRAVMPPSGLPRGAGCGSCGYELTTLVAGRCSECGAELLEAGVTTRRYAIRVVGSLPAALMGWTVIVIVLGGGALAVGAAVAPMTTWSTPGAVQVPLVTNMYRPIKINGDGFEPRTASAEYQIEIVFDGETDPLGGGAAVGGTLCIGVEGQDVATPLTMEYDVETTGYTITAGDGTELESGEEYTAERAGLLLLKAGLDLTHPGIVEESIQVGELFDGALSDPMGFGTQALLQSEASWSAGGLANISSDVVFGNTGSIIRTTSTTSVAGLVTAGSIVGLGLLLYLVGIALITRRRSGLLAPAQV